MTRRGFILTDALLALALSSFVILLGTGILINAAVYFGIYSRDSAVFLTGARLLSVIESRVANAGIGIPKGDSVENAFRFPNGDSPLTGWKSAVEVLDADDKAVPFRMVDGHSVARGVRLRILSSVMFMTGVKAIAPNFTLSPHESADIELIKPKKESYVFTYESGSLSSWMSLPSFGRPFVVTELILQSSRTNGSMRIQNPTPLSLDWGGADMPHSFRLAYFHAENGTFYIRDSAKRDTTNDYPPSAIHKEPISDGINAVCFELNAAKGELRAWILIQSQGVTGEWPSWGGINKGGAVITDVWKIIN